MVQDKNVFKGNVSQERCDYSTTGTSAGWTSQLVGWPGSTATGIHLKGMCQKERSDCPTTGMSAFTGRPVAGFAKIYGTVPNKTTFKGNVSQEISDCPTTGMSALTGCLQQMDCQHLRQQEYIERECVTREV